jgi:hypothetical protein
MHNLCLSTMHNDRVDRDTVHATQQEASDEAGWWRVDQDDRVAADAEKGAPGCTQAHLSHAPTGGGGGSSPHPPSSAGRGARRHRPDGPGAAQEEARAPSRPSQRASAAARPLGAGANAHRTATRATLECAEKKDIFEPGTVLPVSAQMRAAGYSTTGFPHVRFYEQPEWAARVADPALSVSETPPAHIVREEGCFAQFSPHPGMELRCAFCDGSMSSLVAGAAGSAHLSHQAHGSCYYYDMHWPRPWYPCCANCASAAPEHAL